MTAKKNKEYIIEAGARFDQPLQHKVQTFLGETGGSVIQARPGAYLMLVSASEEAVERIKAIPEITLVAQNHKRIVKSPKPPGL